MNHSFKLYVVLPKYVNRGTSCDDRDSYHSSTPSSRFTEFGLKPLQKRTIRKKAFSKLKQPTRDQTNERQDQQTIQPYSQREQFSRRIFGPTTGSDKPAASNINESFFPL